jgi:hypothetical protein
MEREREREREYHACEKMEKSCNSCCSMLHPFFRYNFIFKKQLYYSAVDQAVAVQISSFYSFKSTSYHE